MFFFNISSNIIQVFFYFLRQLNEQPYNLQVVVVVQVWA